MNLKQKRNKNKTFQFFEIFEFLGIVTAEEKGHMSLYQTPIKIICSYWEGPTYGNMFATNDKALRAF